MAHFMKTMTLVNSGKRRKRKLSPAQIRFFGTKRQRAALKARGHRKRTSNPSIRKYKRVSKHRHGGVTSMLKSNVKRFKAKARATKVRRRTSNPSRILTLSLPTINNPRKKRSKKTTMARTKRRVHRRKRVANPVRRRRVTAVRRRRHTRRSNPATAKVVYRYRKNRARRRTHRRNPSMLRGRAGSIGGMLAGAATTYFVVGMLPASLTTGMIGWATIGAVALVQGKVVGGVFKKAALGRDMTTGGLLYLGLRVISDVFPSIGGYLPFSLKGGMGLIAPSSFYTPQVNQAGSMGSFIRPSAVGMPIAVVSGGGMSGINSGNRSVRRVGRVA